ncbi:MAG: pgaC [Magnetococcales bacterium]|nr:pgaC [Magnetococcales bacterium]HIJ84408.1 glycosyltransferase [Magnetococcales bacterium]
MNEEKHAADTVETICAACTDLVSYEIVAVDDGSSDGTYENLLKTKRTRRNTDIMVLRNGINRGVGFSFLLAALLGRGQWIIYVPGDNVVMAKGIRDILERRYEKDIVISHHSGDLDPRSRSRVFISRLFTATVNIISSNKVLYYNGIILFPRKHVCTAPAYYSSPAFQCEVLCHLLRRGLSYVHVHIPVREHSSEARGREESAILKLKNVLPVIYSLWKIFKIRVFNKA